MGRLLTIHPCPICNYYVDGDLHEGGSGIAPMFLKNHYALATCNECHQIVSVLVPNTDQETQAALKQARHDIVQMEADAVIGDRRARELLPLFREALDTFDENVPAAVSTCTMCGSTDVEIQQTMTGDQFDESEAWMTCPQCSEGRLLVETNGQWD